VQRQQLLALLEPSARSLQLVTGLQWLQSVGQVVALLGFYWFGFELPYPALWAACAAFAIWNALGSVLGKVLPGRGVTPQLIAHLGVQCLTLTVFLYFSGGAANPFVSLYLVPLALAAVLLQPLALSLLVAFCVLAYTLMLNINVPLQPQQLQHHSDPGFSLHVLGMWANFVISTVLIVVFLFLLARTARRESEALAQLREEALLNQHVTSIGGVAASAAHALGTPLSTLTIVLDELADPEGLPAARRQSLLEHARSTVSQCRERLLELLRADPAGRADLPPETVSEFIGTTVRRWNLQRPLMQVTLGDLPAGALVPRDITVRHCLMTLLDNAADANAAAARTGIRVRAEVVDRSLAIEVEDEGGTVAGSAGARADADVRGGAGVGLMIARANLARLGGSLGFAAGAAGRVAWMRLPLGTAP